MQALHRSGAAAIDYPRVQSQAFTKLDHHVLALGLVYAILVSPFIGGVRGWPCTLGWLVPPVIWLWRTSDLQGLGLRVAGGHRFTKLALAMSAGFLCGLALVALGSLFPAVTKFTLALPALHRNADYGNVKLFIALIPIGHFVHEVFYRGFLQKQLALRLQSPWLAILLSALLYSWTHVFIFSSNEFQTIMTAVVGTNSGVADVERTLAGVVSFSMVESVGAGLALHWTSSVWACVVFRVANLVTVILLVYPRYGLL